LSAASELQARIVALERLLAGVYGEKPWRPVDPLDALVLTILSQNTNDVNRDRAFARLREHFPTWEAVRDAPPDAVVEAIRPAGLAPTKGPHIQAALRRISEERGALDLSFLANLPLEEARAWLLDMPGVGFKTAAIVLLFALGRPAFPVDTHVHRLAQRLGLIAEGTSRQEAHRLLEEVVPPDLYYSFHLNLIEHGRAVCHARRPACQNCVLRGECAFYRAQGEMVSEKEGGWSS